MKRLLIAAFAALASVQASSAFEWDETGYYYPEQEPDNIWTEWEPFTTCDIEWSGINQGFWSYDVEVKKRVSVDPENHKWQWCFVKQWLGSGADVIVEYDPDNNIFRIPVQRRGVNNVWDGEPHLLTDWRTYYGTDDPYSSWDPVDGILKIFEISFYPNQDLGDGTFGNKPTYYGTHNIYMHGFVKYDVNFGISELVDSFNQKLKVDFTTHPTDISWELVNDLVLPTDTVLIDRIALDKKNPMTEPGEIEITLKEGINSLVGISYDKDKKRVTSIKNIYCMPEDRENWKKLGTGIFTEDALTGLGSDDWHPLSMNVEIEENVNRPGFYRIVDPYRQLPATFGEFNYEHSGRTDYMYIDASRPNEVVLKAYATGIRENELGKAFLTSAAYEGKRMGKLKPEYIDYCGKLKEGVITFPGSSIGVRLPEYTKALGNKDIIYWVNRNDKFTIELPVLSSVSEIEVSGTPEATYYNLQGARVANPSKGDVLIEVSENGSRKVIF